MFGTPLSWVMLPFRRRIVVCCLLGSSRFEVTFENGMPSREFWASRLAPEEGITRVHVGNYRRAELRECPVELPSGGLICLDGCLERDDEGRGWTWEEWRSSEPRSPSDICLQMGKTKALDATALARWMEDLAIQYDFGYLTLRSSWSAMIRLAILFPSLLLTTSTEREGGAEAGHMRGNEVFGRRALQDERGASTVREITTLPAELARVFEAYGELRKRNDERGQEW